MGMKMFQASNTAPGCRPKERVHITKADNFSASRDRDVIGKQMIRQSRFAAGEESGGLAGPRRALPGSRVTAHDRNPNIVIFMKHRLRSLADGQTRATVAMM